jgi:hypothetical protein
MSDVVNQSCLTGKPLCQWVVHFPMDDNPGKPLWFAWIILIAQSFAL